MRAMTSPRATSSPARRTRSETTPSNGAVSRDLRQLVVRLREQRTRHLQVRFREVAVRLRLVDVEARNGVARRAQARDFALERDQVDFGPLDPRGLLGAGERQLARVETGDELRRP